MSSGQRKLLGQLGVSIHEGCTRGQAAQMITHAMALQQVRPLEAVMERALLRGAK